MSPLKTTSSSGSGSERNRKNISGRVAEMSCNAPPFFANLEDSCTAIASLFDSRAIGQREQLHQTPKSEKAFLENDMLFQIN